MDFSTIIFNNNLKMSNKMILQFLLLNYKDYHKIYIRGNKVCVLKLCHRPNMLICYEKGRDLYFVAVVFVYLFTRHVPCTKLNWMHMHVVEEWWCSVVVDTK
jgi:hypothetical protein